MAKYSHESLDEYVKRRFLGVTQAALAKRLHHWQLQPQSFVALVIVLDQFPRRIYRGTPAAYSGDMLTGDITLRAIESSVCSSEKGTKMLMIDDEEDDDEKDEERVGVA